MIFNFQMKFLESLNSKQQKAITLNNGKGAVLVTAGPGTGKTKTLTAKIFYLIQIKKINPKDILVLTFTSKAAEEIKERVKSQNSNQNPLIITFHALGLKILKKLDKKKAKKIIEEKEKKQLIWRIIKENKIPRSKLKKSKKILLEISKTKNLSLCQTTQPLFKLYQKELEKQNLYDFDDLLTKSFELIKKNKKSGFKFKYVLVDEFQDTNKIQFKILKSIVKKPVNIFAIGDKNQSIYAFRGANPKAFNDFGKHFKNPTHVTFDINYRSKQRIVKISNKIFPDVLKLKAYQNQKGQVKLIKTYNQISEAKWITKKISQKIGGINLNQASEMQNKGEKEIKFKDFAVIYRLKKISNTIKKQLRNAGIPFQATGEEAFWQKKEINFIINILKFLKSANDRDLHEIIQSPFNYIPGNTFEKIKKLTNKDRTVKNLIFNEQNLELQTQLDSKELEKVKKFKKNIDFIKKYSKKNKLLPLTAQIIKKFKLKKSGQNPEKETIFFEFKNALVAFENLANPLQKFLDYYNKLSLKNFYDQKADKVTLCTMHSAKGLEFRYVFIIGFENGITPLNTKDKQEEKRLFYVAVTRAKSNLYLLFSQKRFSKKNKISDFYNLIKDSNIKELIDPSIEKIKKKIAIKKARESQTKLF
ncbi:MAG: AAA family ATPase [Candidatus Moranbacteria bacterium]|nr:AAA family ATPase [Candidatus Moranbacteria bacterium]